MQIWRQINNDAMICITFMQVLDAKSCDDGQWCCNTIMINIILLLLDCEAADRSNFPYRLIDKHPLHLIHSSHSRSIDDLHDPAQSPVYFSGGVEELRGGLPCGEWGLRMRWAHGQINLLGNTGTKTCCVCSLPCHFHISIKCSTTMILMLEKQRAPLHDRTTKSLDNTQPTLVNIVLYWCKFPSKFAFNQFT